MRRRGLALALGGIVALLILVVALPLIVLHYNAGALRPVVISRLQAATGRDVTIGGDFDLALSLSPAVAAGDVRLANAEGGSDQPMVEAERVVVTVDLWTLLRHRSVHIGAIEIENATILLERDAEGNGNWQFARGDGGDGGGGGAPRLLVDDVTVADSQVIWRNLATGAEERLRLDEASWQAGGTEEWVEVALQGSFRDRPLGLTGEVGSVARAFSPDGDYPVDLALRWDDIRVNASGGLPLRPQEAGEGLKVSVQGERLADVGEFTGVALPLLGAYEGSLLVRRAPEGGLRAERVTFLAGEPEAASIALDGTIADLRALAGFDLAFEASGPQAETLAGWIRLNLPAEGPFAVAGRVTGSLKHLSLTELAGAAGSQGKALVRIEGGRIESLAPLGGVEAPLRISGDGLERLGPLLKQELLPLGAYDASLVLRGGAERLSVGELEGSLSAPGLELSLTGGIAQVSPPSGLDVQLALDAAGLGTLGALFGQKLPPAPPLRLQGRLRETKDGGYELGELRARLGESDAAGALRFSLAGEVPQLGGTLRSNRVVVEDLLALAEGGSPPEAAPEETADSRLVPAVPIPVDLLRTLEGSLDWTIDRLVLEEDETLENVALNLVLREGRLSARPFVLHLAQGVVEGEASVAADGNEAALSLEASGKDLELAELLRGAGGVEGEVDTIVNLSGSGRTLRAVLGDLQGSARVLVDEGSIEGDQLHRMVSDLDLFAVLFRQRENVQINCLVGRVAIKDGEGRSEAMLDTQRMTLLGHGTVDLDQETIDAELVPKAKSRKLSTLAVPVEIDGTLADPRVQPRKGEAIGQALRGVIGGLLVPLNVVSSLFGKAETDACSAAVEQARDEIARGGEKRRQRTQEAQKPAPR